MNDRFALSLVLNAHQSFVRFRDTEKKLEDGRLFQSITETYLPLLRVFERLDADRIPFRIALSISPLLCDQLRDPQIRSSYVAYLDRRIEFGGREVERTHSDPQTHRLAKMYYDQMVDDRIQFVERYEGDILRAFDFFHKKGRLELLTTAATYPFLPFYTSYPEAIQAQLEMALITHRSVFGRNPQGFWLPELGWSEGLDEFLRAYSFSYTIVESHGLIFGHPTPVSGTFAPIKTKSSVAVFGRDFYATKDLLDTECGYVKDSVYRNPSRDVAFELPAQSMAVLLEAEEVRNPSGFKYWNNQTELRDSNRSFYDAGAAAKRAQEHAKMFLDNRLERLQAAKELASVADLSLCAFDADLFGRQWFEGPQFIEALFRETARREDVHFVTPFEYINKKELWSLQTSTPEFSSWKEDGYAQTWLDSSNDWMYRHLLRSIDRMIELAERFPDGAGLKERALDQAAREILLAQDALWASNSASPREAAISRHCVEEFLHNFTNIYESLGSNYISTEWLTDLERRHGFFSEMNYRVFKKKR